MLFEWYAEQDPALRQMVEVHRKRHFLSAYMRQTVQNRVGLNGDGYSTLDKEQAKEQAKAIKHVDFLDVPVRLWKQVR